MERLQMINLDLLFLQMMQEIELLWVQYLMIQMVLVLAMQEFMIY